MQFNQKVLINALQIDLVAWKNHKHITRSKYVISVLF